MNGMEHGEMMWKNCGSNENDRVNEVNWESVESNGNGMRQQNAFSANATAIER